MSQLLLENLTNALMTELIDWFQCSQVSITNFGQRREQMGCRQLARSSVAVRAQKDNDTGALCKPSNRQSMLRQQSKPQWSGRSRGYDVVRGDWNDKAAEVNPTPYSFILLLCFGVTQSCFILIFIHGAVALAVTRPGVKKAECCDIGYVSYCSTANVKVQPTQLHRPHEAKND